MSEFASVEADELVTKRLPCTELAKLRAEMSAIRADIAERLHQQTVGSARRWPEPSR